MSSSFSPTEPGAPAEDPPTLPGATPGEQGFHVSRKSRSGRMRRVLPMTALGMIVANLLIQFAMPMPHGMAELLPTQILFLLVFGYAYWRMTRRLNAPGPALVFGPGGMRVGAALTSRPGAYPWTAIESAELSYATRGYPVLKLVLDPRFVGEDRKYFLGGRKSRPVIALSYFEPGVIEQIAQALRAYLQAAGRWRTAPAALQSEAFEQQTAFEARLGPESFKPWLVLCLIGINVLVYLLMAFSRGGFAPFPSDVLLRWGGNAASEVQRGQWWRLFTAMFVHESVPHILFNMIGLLAFGAMVERFYGWRQTLLIYLVAGLVGNATSLHYGAQHAVSVGASGAIYGVIGAWVAMMYWHRKTLPRTYTRYRLMMVLYVGNSLLQGFSNPHIDHAAHVGGLLSGIVLAGLLSLRTDETRTREQGRSRMLLGGLGGTLAVALLVALAPPAKLDALAAARTESALVRSMDDLRDIGASVQGVQAQIHAGKLTERQAQAPIQGLVLTGLQRAHEDLQRVHLAPNDPRGPMYTDLREIYADMVGLAGIPTVYRNAADTQGEPADPVEALALKQDLDMELKRLKHDAAAARGA